MKLVSVLAVLTTTAAHAQWEALPALPTSGAAREYCGGLAVGSDFYVIGGTPWQAGGDEDGAVHRLRDGSWVGLPPLDGMGPLIAQGSGYDALGRIIVYAGYHQEDGGTNEAKIYDPLLGPETNIAERIAPEEAFGLFAWATDDLGRLYGLGGGPGVGGTNSGYCDRYDPLTDTWEVIAPMPTPAADACAVDDGLGRILVIGGINVAGDSRLSNVAMYDITTGLWSDTTIPDLPVPTSGARAVLGADGRVYVLGGETGAIGSGTTQSNVYILDQLQTAWSSGPAMSTPRKWFAAALGSDDSIYVAGGSNDSGGTNTAERLFTSACPFFISEPVSANAWEGTVARLSVAAGGADPLSFRWRRNGADLFDGPTGTGSTVQGADTPNLMILAPGEDDEGMYDVVVSNACGLDSLSGPAEITLLTRPSSWTVESIHTPGALSSVANGVSADRIGGAKTIPTDLGDTRIMDLSHPVIWDRATLTPVTHTPPGSVGGTILDVEGEMATGWYWHTWSCWGGTQYWTCAWQSASVWVGNPPVFDEVHRSGAEYDSVKATNGVESVGTVTYEYSEGNYSNRAYIWSGPNNSGRPVHPSWAGSSFLSGLDDTHQYGYIHTPNPGAKTHAAIWSGSADSCVDVHPAGYSRSWMNAGGDGIGVGSAYLGDTPRAGLWMSNGSFFDLTPPGAPSSSLSATDGGVQAGSGPDGTGLWFGTPESYVSIAHVVPTGYANPIIKDIHVGPNGSISMVGSATNTIAGRSEAMFWQSAACDGDANGDGTVDVNDISYVLFRLGGPPPDGDTNADGAVDVNDISYVLFRLGGVCS